MVEWWRRLDALRRAVLLVGVVLLCTLGVIGLKRWRAKLPKYEWTASNSGAAGCPMEILPESSFFSPDGSSLYIPETTVSLGWGDPVSAHVVGPDEKSLPSRFELTFLSYLEDKVYRAEFALPYERISALFASGYATDEEKSGRGEYNCIVAGAAPGGIVAVWVGGSDRQEEVFYGRAEEIEYDLHAAMHIRPDLSRADFVKVILEDEAGDNPLVHTYMEKTPFGLWDRYHKRYRWQPVFEGFAPPAPHSIRSRFYNGEYGILDWPSSSPLRYATPSYLSLPITSMNLRASIHFDEPEILAAFEHMGERDQPFELVFTLEDGHRMRVSVRNPHESIELGKTNAEVFTPRVH